MKEKIKEWLENAKTRGEKALKFLLCCGIAIFTSLLLYPLFPLTTHNGHCWAKYCLLWHMPLFLVLGIGFAWWLYRKT